MVAVANLAPAHTARLSLVPPPAAPAQTYRAEDYLGLVRKVAYGMIRRLPPHIDVADLVSAGTIGLLDAIAKYDAARNDNFEAYAELRVRGAIIDELRRGDWVPRSVREKSRRLGAATRTLEGTLGRAAADEEVAQAMDISIEALHELKNAGTARPMLSLDSMVSEAGEPQLGTAAASDEDILGQLCQASTTEALARAIDGLPERARTIISLYYLEGLKQKEIGAILGVTESRVCQVMKQAVQTLAKSIREAE